MKLSNSAIMKKIALLNSEKEDLTRRERNTNFIEYTTKDDKKQALEGNDYNYEETTKRIEEIDKEVLYLKGKLALANATTLVEGYDLTIGQCLVKLGQINEAISRYNSLSSNVQKSSQITSNGIITYSECLHDVKVAKEEYQKLLEEKANLQVAIDKINLFNEIEL